MTRLSRLFGLAALGILLPAKADAFEGVLNMVMTMPSVAPVKTVVSIRDNGDSRTDTMIPFLNQKVSFIQRGKLPVIQIMHSTLQYTESSYLQSKSAASVTSALKDVTVHELGTEMIAGYPCRHALLTNTSGSKVEVWVTSSIPSGASAAMGSDDLMQALKKNGLDGFPLKVKMSEQGLPIVLEATSVEAKRVDASLFSVPSGYTKVKESELNLADLSAADAEVLKNFEKQMMQAGE